MSAAVVAPYVEMKTMPMDEDEWVAAVGRELAVIRSEKGLTQEDMIKRLGKSRSTIIRMESGQSNNWRDYLRYMSDLEVEYDMMAVRVRRVLRARNISSDDLS